MEKEPNSKPCVDKILEVYSLLVCIAQNSRLLLKKLMLFFQSECNWVTHFAMTHHHRRKLHISHNKTLFLLDHYKLFKRGNCFSR